MKDLGIDRRFLGMNIEYEDGSIKLHLKQYLSVLLEGMGCQNATPYPRQWTPA
jgi:hypothetical protein